MIIYLTTGQLSDQQWALVIHSIPVQSRLRLGFPSRSWCFNLDISNSRCVDHRIALVIHLTTVHRASDFIAPTVGFMSTIHCIILARVESQIGKKISIYRVFNDNIFYLNINWEFNYLFLNTSKKCLLFITIRFISHPRKSNSLRFDELPSISSNNMQNNNKGPR